MKPLRDGVLALSIVLSSTGTAQVLPDRAGTAEQAVTVPPRTDETAYDRHPSVKHLSLPAYPLSRMCAGVRGTVVLVVRLDATGHPIDIRVQRSSGDSTLDRNAIMASRNASFNPALRDGTPIPGKALVPFVFEPETAPQSPECKKYNAEHPSASSPASRQATSSRK